MVGLGIRELADGAAPASDVVEIGGRNPRGRSRLDLSGVDAQAKTERAKDGQLRRGVEAVESSDGSNSAYAQARASATACSIAQPASSAARIHPAAGSTPPVASTTTSMSLVRTSSMRSVQTILPAPPDESRLRFR